MNSIETTIIEHLITDEDYTRKVQPFLKAEYFMVAAERILYETISTFFVKYNSLPNVATLKIELDNNSTIGENEFTAITQLLSELSTPKKVDKQWLLDTTENFCKDKAIYNGVMESIQILDGNSDKSKGAITELLSDALAVSFDNHIGHDFLEDSDARFDFYHKVEHRIPFDLEYLNKITKGGVPRKTLNIILGAIGGGKTLVMCHMAGTNMLDGLNVLYITLEMAEERIAERIDANLLNISLNDIENLPKALYDKKIEKVKGKTAGKLIIKEYPTAQAGAGHFRHLLNELKLKRDFTPDVVYIDYLNICISTRVKNVQANSYTIVKSIAEEVRGLAVEKNIPIWSATQVTRAGFDSSDVGLTDTAESFGLPATADFMVAIISTEELDELNQIMFKQLKNRYNDDNKWKRFVVGRDKGKMRLYDVEQKAQEDISDTGDTDDTPAFDNSEFGERAKEDDQMKWSTKKRGRKNFGALNV